MAQDGPISFLPWNELMGTGRKSLSHSTNVPTWLPTVMSPDLEWASLLEEQARPEAELGDGWRRESGWSSIPDSVLRGPVLEFLLGLCKPSWGHF